MTPTTPTTPTTPRPFASPSIDDVEALITRACAGDTSLTSAQLLRLGVECVTRGARVRQLELRGAALAAMEDDRP